MKNTSSNRKHRLINILRHSILQSGITAEIFIQIIFMKKIDLRTSRRIRQGWVLGKIWDTNSKINISWTTRLFQIHNNTRGTSRRPRVLGIGMTSRAMWARQMTFCFKTCFTSTLNSRTSWRRIWFSTVKVNIGRRDTFWSNNSLITKGFSSKFLMLISKWDTDREINFMIKHHICTIIRMKLYSKCPEKYNNSSINYKSNSFKLKYCSKIMNPDSWWIWRSSKTITPKINMKSPRVISKAKLNREDSRIKTLTRSSSNQHFNSFSSRTRINSKLWTTNSRKERYTRPTCTTNKKWRRSITKDKIKCTNSIRTQSSSKICSIRHTENPQYIISKRTNRKLMNFLIKISFECYMNNVRICFKLLNFVKK